MKDTLITKKRLAALAAAVLLMPCFMTFAEDEDLQGQLSDVQSQMEQQQQKKGAAEVTIGSVSERLRAIQDALDTAMKEYKSITQEITATEKKIADTQKELDKAQKELESRQKVLSKRIRDIYMHGQLNYLDVVIGAKDFNDFANRVELLRRIIAADMDLISNIRDEQSRISEAKATLEKEHERQAQLQA
ncbi:MAG: coiled-coil domain-containing protein, partial [Megasphaera micronuciformis]